MSPDLAILLFLEFEPAPVASIIDLLEGNGAARSWSEGRRFIFRFESPTAAIIASEVVLKHLPILKGEDRARMYIDTCEVSFEASIPNGPAITLGWNLLGRGKWNMVYFSESTRVTLQHSEHRFLSRPEEWLERGVGKVSLNRLVLNYSEVRIAREEESKGLSDNLSAITPAPHGRRALAGLTDFLLALLVLVAVRIAINAPLVLGVIGSRKVIEAEAMEIKHGYVSPTWLASSGAVVHMGMGASLTSSFPYETGTYKVRVVYKTFDDLVKIKIRVGDESFDFIGNSTRGKFSDQAWEHLDVYEKYYTIRHGEEFSVQKNEGEEGTPDIDYVQFVAPDDHLYPRSKRYNVLRSEDFLRLIGVWDYEDLKYHLRDLFVLCPAIQMFFHVLLLSVVCWTPGAWVAGIRIVSRQGRRVPGVGKGLLRVLGYVLSIIPFIGVGLIWPLIVNKSENWADAFSQTRVIACGSGSNEE